MKFVLYFILIISISFASCTRIIESEEISAEINTILKEYYGALENQDLQTISDLYWHDSTTTVLIADPPGQLIGWEQIVKYFQRQFNNIKEIKTWRKNEVIHTSEFNKVVWVSSLNHCEIVQPEGTTSYNYYQTFILEQIGGSWKFVYSHASRIGEKIVEHQETKKTTDVKPEITPLPQTSDTTIVDSLPDTTKTLLDTTKTIDSIKIK